MRAHSRRALTQHALPLATFCRAAVVPLELQRDDGTTGERKYRTKNGTFFVGTEGTDVSFDCDCNPRTACCAGQGCIRQTIEGDDLAFVWSFGTVMHKELAEGEQLVLETTALIAWEEGVELDIQMTGNMCTACCGGEGLFNTTVTGPGNVYFQSYTKGKMVKALQWYVRFRPARGMMGGVAFDGGLG